MAIGEDFREWCVRGALVRARPSDEIDRRGQRLVFISSLAAALVSLGFAIVGFAFGGPTHIAVVNLGMVAAFAAIPLLRPLGALAPHFGFVIVATATLCVLTVLLGTKSGLLFYFFIMIAATPMVVGIRRMRMALAGVVVWVIAVVVLEFKVPADTGAAPSWMLTGGFVANAIAAGVMAAVIVGYGLLQIQRIESALEEEHRRSEALLDNILPKDISRRLKEPERQEIADAYDDASVLFADIAGFTSMSSASTPAEVVRFLDQLYTELDTLIAAHGLEKIKTTGDSYMVLSGVPLRRPDHLEALAHFALAMCQRSASLTGPDGRRMELRIGMASGPVVAGVVGSKKFFYDVWGDAVNVASRMESTGVPGRIQVTSTVRDRLAESFEFEERGSIEVKGKEPQLTWFLTGARR